MAHRTLHATPEYTLIFNNHMRFAVHQREMDLHELVLLGTLMVVGLRVTLPGFLTVVGWSKQL